MKQTTKRIIETFPQLEGMIKEYPMDQEALEGLDNLQSTFLTLARFFERPDQEGFDLQTLYEHLDNEWLEFALELITEYFRKDTYLIQSPSYSLIKEDHQYLSLSQFAEYLKEEGLRYDRQKLNLYFQRGKVPQPDLVVGGVKYWAKETAQLYGEQEKMRANE